MSVKEMINTERLPRHIAIIMDGNGRWAQEKGEDRLFGHLHGVESVRNIVEGAAELGIEVPHFICVQYRKLGQARI
jgi:undecaprenyl diphosphate synthase